MAGIMSMDVTIGLGVCLPSQLVLKVIMQILEISGGYEAIISPPSPLSPTSLTSMDFSKVTSVVQRLKNLLRSSDRELVGMIRSYLERGYHPQSDSKCRRLVEQSIISSVGATSFVQSDSVAQRLRGDIAIFNVRKIAKLESSSSIFDAVMADVSQFLEKFTITDEDQSKLDDISKRLYLDLWPEEDKKLFKLEMFTEMMGTIQLMDDSSS
jgi:hypothetical protein